MQFQRVATDEGPIKVQDQVVGFGREDLPPSQQGFDAFFDKLVQAHPISRADFDADVLRSYERSPEG
jgi:hypothetical protein